MRCEVESFEEKPRVGPSSYPKAKDNRATTRKQFPKQSFYNSVAQLWETIAVCEREKKRVSPTVAGSPRYGQANQGQQQEQKADGEA
jgi:coenzyme F420-reducing hydrogenase alpha subunit